MKTDEKQWKNNEKVWLEDFDPGSRTSTRTSRFSRRQELLASTRGTTTGHYNGETQRGNKRGTNGKNEKWKKMIFFSKMHII